jgi:hypothetical protein
VLILTIFLLLGLIFRPDRSATWERGEEMVWIKSLFDVEHVGE